MVDKFPYCRAQLVDSKGTYILAEALRSKDTDCRIRSLKALTALSGGTSPRR